MGENLTRNKWTVASPAALASNAGTDITNIRYNHYIADCEPHAELTVT